MLATKSSPKVIAEVRKLRAAWDATLQATQAAVYGPTIKQMQAEEQAYDALVEYVDANDLTYTEHDPRGPETMPEEDEPLTQTQARAKAQRLNATTGRIHVAVTIPLGCWGGTETGWAVQGPDGKLL